jgi:ABC-type sugar transport system, permease component
MNIKKGERLFATLNGIMLFTIGIITFYPFYYLVIYSLSSPSEASKGVYILPRGLTLINYISVFRQGIIFHTIFISLSRTVLGTIITVICSSMFAYGISKPELPFRKLINRMLFITIYFNAGIIPWYITMKNLHLKNNFLLYILPTAVVAFYIVILKTNFEQLPKELEESAMIDGAGYFSRFVKIIFPLCVPIIAVVSLFQGIWQWNSWVDNFYLCSSDQLMTLQLYLLNFITQYSANYTAILTNTTMKVNVESLVTPTSIRMAITIVALIPVLCVYPFLQNFFVKGILIGAVKG